MNTQENTSTAAPKKSWWRRLVWWKKCALVVIGLVLLEKSMELGLNLNNTYFMPEQAKVEAIETHYQAQLERLHYLAEDPQARWNKTLESCQLDKGLFASPEIVSAALVTSPPSFKVVGDKFQEWHSAWLESPRRFSPLPGHSCTLKSYRTMNDGSKMTVIEYHATHGQVGILLEFDLAKLKP